MREPPGKAKKCHDNDHVAKEHGWLKNDLRPDGGQKGLAKNEWPECASLQNSLSLQKQCFCLSIWNDVWPRPRPAPIKEALPILGGLEGLLSDVAKVSHGRRVGLGERLGSGDGEGWTLNTRQIAFEPLPASVLFASDVITF